MFIFRFMYNAFYNKSITWYYVWYFLPNVSDTCEEKEDILRHSDVSVMVKYCATTTTKKKIVEEFLTHKTSGLRHQSLRNSIKLKTKYFSLEEMPFPVVRILQKGISFE